MPTSKRIKNRKDSFGQYSTKNCNYKGKRNNSANIVSELSIKQLLMQWRVAGKIRMVTSFLTTNQKAAAAAANLYQQNC